MDKLEKVIKGLEWALENMVDSINDFRFAGYDGPCVLLNQPIVSDTLSLLKAQEAVRPVAGLWDRDIQLFNCGACGGEIGAGGIAKYCFHCGRKVKWE